MGTVMLVLLVAVLVTAVYAFVHAALQRPDAYTAADKLTKPVWLVILGAAVALASILYPVLGVLGMAPPVRPACIWSTCGPSFSRFRASRANGMKALVAVSAVAVVALLGVSSAQADPEADPGAGEANYGGPPSSPRLVDHTEWAQWGSLPSLRVYPSQVGRTASRRLGMAAADAAWAEVLALSPEADTAGMRAQFICHWQYAEIRQPGKPSWNLEPWRPVVDDSEMLASGCNPGSPEESF